MGNVTQTSHSGIKLDPRVTSGDVPEVHAHVEPIPWKTGRVGAVDAIDRDTSWSLPAAVSVVAPARASTKEPEKKTGGCGTGACGCKTTAAASASSAAPAAVVASPVVPVPKKAKIDPKLPGSGIPARRSMRILVWVRRASQVFFFGLFCWFLFQTGFRGSFAAQADAAVRLPYPVEAYLLADPFVGAMTVLSTHTVYRGLLWSVGLLALTLVFGRVFCGWICPFGTLHHFVAWLWPS
ncbi:MAG TPA: 4Fe-4S binding protein, partial [Polyangiaceae bacterium]